MGSVKLYIKTISMSFYLEVIITKGNFICIKWNKGLHTFLKFIYF